MIELTVIIPTRDRAQLLHKLLDALSKQTISQNLFEVIVIDNGSTDNTKAIVEKFKKSLVKHLKYVYAKSPGMHVGRHLGLKHSQGQILIYADDDVVPNSKWLQAIYNGFLQHPEVVLIGGKDLPNFECEPPNWILDLWKKDFFGNKCVSLLSIIDLGDSSKFINPFYVFGCNFSIRKSTVIEAGGFHPDKTTPQEVLFMGDGETHIARHILKNKLKTLYLPSATVYHFVSKQRMTMEYFKSRSYEQGVTNSYADIRQQNHAPISHVLYTQFIYLLRKLKPKSKQEKECFKEYIRGYTDHQQKAKRDPNFYNWVIKDNYLDMDHA